LIAFIGHRFFYLSLLSIASSVAISRGGMGAKFIRVLFFFVTFSLIGMALAIIAFNLFSHYTILPDPSTIGDTSSNLKQTPFALKIYGVLTSALMISIYAYHASP